jgi:hypothetical protein
MVNGRFITAAANGRFIYCASKNNTNIMSTTQNAEEDVCAPLEYKYYKSQPRIQIA